VQTMSDTYKESFSEGIARAGMRVRPAGHNHTFSGLLAPGRAPVAWSTYRSATSPMSFSTPLMTTVRAAQALEEAVAEFHRGLRQ